MGARGFTLVELVVTLTLTGIVAALVARGLAPPIRGFVDSARRAELVDIADTAQARIAREVRLALPNSIRVTGTSLELLRTVDGGRYRARPAAGGGGAVLDFGAASGTFDVLGPLFNAGAVAAGPGGRAACLAGAIHCLAIYNLGQAGADAYSGDNLAGISAVTLGPVTQISFDNSDVPGWRFPFPSPRQRFQIIDTPVSFVCDLGAGELRRHQGYPITAVQNSNPGGSVALLADRVSACSFRYTPGAGTRSGLLTVALSVSAEGETVHLLQQVHVANVP